MTNSLPPTKNTLDKVMSYINRIWESEGRPVSYRDFIGKYSKNYIRHIFSKLHKQGRIQRYGINSRPQFWIPIPERIDGNIGTYGGGNKISLLEFLESLGWGPLCMHDIRLQFYSKELCGLVYDGFNMLLLHGFKKRGDGSIESFEVRWGRSKKRRSRMVFYNTGTVVTEINCSEEPIMIEETPLMNFNEHLIDLRRRIIIHILSIYKRASLPLDEYLPLPETWILKQLHLNRDAKISDKISLDSMCITLNELNNTFRAYLKRHNCAVRCRTCDSLMRLETIVKPNKSLAEFMREILGLPIHHSRSPSYIG